MFEFFGELGDVIDKRHLSMLMTQEVPLVNPVGYNTSAYDNSITAIYDFAIDMFKLPVIGITLKPNIGYAYFSYLDKDKKKRCRVYINLIGNTTRNAKAFNDLGLSAYLYDIDPPPSKERYGLEVYSDKGELVFDSEYPPLKIGWRTHSTQIVFINQFVTIEWLGRGVVHKPDLLKQNQKPMLFTLQDRQMVDIAETMSSKPDFYNQPFYRFWQRTTGSNPIIGYL